MKWKKILGISFFSFVALSSVFSFTIFSKSKTLAINNEIVIEILGHVKSPGKQVVNKETTLGSVIKMAQPLFGAKLSEFNLDLKLFKNATFVITSKTNKSADDIKKSWNSIKSLEDFLELKISKKIAEILWKIKQQKGQPKWSDLASTPGIGKITLGKLKNLLMLES